AKVSAILVKKPAISPIGPAIAAGPRANGGDGLGPVRPRSAAGRAALCKGQSGAGSASRSRATGFAGRAGRFGALAFGASRWGGAGPEHDRGRHRPARRDHPDSGGHRGTGPPQKVQRPRLGTSRTPRLFGPGADRLAVGGGRFRLGLLVAVGRGLVGDPDALA